METRGLVAAIAGGASGMARATAELLAERGAKVAILDRPSSAGEEVAAAIGGDAFFHPLDVRDSASIARALACPSKNADFTLVAISLSQVSSLYSSRGVATTIPT